MSVLEGIVAFFVGLLLVAALTLGGWEAGWWFKNQNVNRESHLLRNSYANQQTLRDQITQQIGNIESITVQIAEVPSAAAALKAQRYAIVNILCGDAAQVTGDSLSPDQAAFVQTNCSAGSISPSSLYYATH